MSSFSKIMENCRIRKGLSLQGAADLLGTTKSHLWEMENGSQKNPTSKLINSIRREYMLSPKDLLDLLDEANSE